MTTTKTGHTLTLNTRAGTVDIHGPLDTMEDIPESEVDAFVARHGVGCQYVSADPQSYWLDDRRAPLGALRLFSVGAPSPAAPREAPRPRRARAGP